MPSDKKYLNFLYGISLFNECDIFEIKDRLEYVINNKDVIIQEYKKWKKEYLKDSLRLFDDFIKE